MSLWESHRFLVVVHLYDTFGNKYALLSIHYACGNRSCICHWINKHNQEGQQWQLCVHVSFDVGGDLSINITDYGQHFLHVYDNNSMCEAPMTNQMWGQFHSFHGRRALRTLAQSGFLEASTWVFGDSFVIAANPYVCKKCEVALRFSLVPEIARRWTGFKNKTDFVCRLKFLGCKAFLSFLPWAWRGRERKVEFSFKLPFLKRCVATESFSVLFNLSLRNLEEELKIQRNRRCRTINVFFQNKFWPCPFKCSTYLTKSKLHKAILPSH